MIKAKTAALKLKRYFTSLLHLYVIYRFTDSLRICFLFKTQKKRKKKEFDLAILLVAQI